MIFDFSWEVILNIATLSFVRSNVNFGLDLFLGVYMDQKSVDSVCSEIDKTIKELIDMNYTACGELERYLVQPVNTIIIMLNGVASALDKKSRICDFEKPNDWKDTLGIINRAFVSLIHSSLEASLDDLILFKKSHLKSSLLKELKADIEKASCVCGTNKDALNKLIKNAERLIKPNFNDKITLVSECLQKDQRKYWKNYFKCLTIIRHKCSHADSIVNNYEKKQLTENGFSNFINSNNIVTMNIKSYIDVYKKLLEFIRNIS